VQGAFLEEEATAQRQGKEAAEAEVLKTMEDIMVLINQSFNLVVRQAEVLYGWPPPSGQFDQDIEVFDGHLVPVGDIQNLQSVDQPISIEDVED